MHTRSKCGALHVVVYMSRHGSERAATITARHRERDNEIKIYWAGAHSTWSRCRICALQSWRVVREPFSSFAAAPCCYQNLRPAHAAAPQHECCMGRAIAPAFDHSLFPLSDGVDVKTQLLILRIKYLICWFSIKSSRANKLFCVRLFCAFNNFHCFVVNIIKVINRK